jgi:hypothetical protein
MDVICLKQKLNASLRCLFPIHPEHRRLQRNPTCRAISMRKLKTPVEVNYRECAVDPAVGRDRTGDIAIQHCLNPHEHP